MTNDQSAHLSANHDHTRVGIAGSGGRTGWNEAIKATIVQVFGTDDSLAGLYTYAILATVLAIVVLTLLGRAAARIGGEAVINRETD